MTNNNLYLTNETINFLSFLSAIETATDEIGNMLYAYSRKHKAEKRRENMLHDKELRKAGIRK